MNENTTDSDCAKECANLREVFAGSPFSDCDNSRFVGKASFVSAMMSYNGDLRYAEEKLGAIKCASTILHSLNDAIEILKVFPHEPSNAGILWNRFVRPVGELISTAWAFYRNVVDVRDRDMRNFVLKDVSNVVVKDRY